MPSKRKSNVKASKNFALVRYEGLENYEVIQSNKVVRNEKGETVAKISGCTFSVKVFHENNNEFIVQDLAYNLNNQSPIVKIIQFNHAERKKSSVSPLHQSREFECISPELGMDAELVSMNAELVTMDAEPVTMDAELFTMDAELVSMNAEPATIDAEPATIDAELDTMDAELVTVDAELIAMDDEPSVVAKGRTDLIAEKISYAKTKKVSHFSTSVLKDEHVVKVDMRSKVVPHSSDKSKKYFCLYCKKQVTNFGRHLLANHKDEGDVMKILKYPKGHSTRSMLIAKIRKQGQSLYNFTNQNSGTVMVIRRPCQQKNRTVNDFLVCPYCKQMYSKLSLRVHVKKCSEKKTNTSSKNNAVEGRQCVLNIHPSATQRLAQQVLPKCRRDYITELVSFDELSVLYGNKLVSKYKDLRHNIMIRSRMRSIGRFLKEFIQAYPHLQSLREILDPSNYDKIVEIINKIGGLDEKTGHYTAPSTAYGLGLQLKNIVIMYESQCIKEKCPERRAAARDLYTLMNDGFQVDINKTVLENQSEMKRQKKVELPTKADILALKKYLDQGVKTSHSKFLRTVSLSNWKELAGFTLIALQLFNRRRAGEIERIYIKDFHSYEFVNEADDAFKSVQVKLKHLASLYGRFFIRGKLNRKVPVLISRDMIDYINILLKHREDVGIASDNPYVFGTPGSSQNHLKACDLMRKYSTECGAPNPHTLRGTELRKQIATACSLYNLPDVLVDDVAKHLGHHVDIHKNIYRQSTANEIPTMVNILRKAMGDDEQEKKDERFEEEEEHERFEEEEEHGDGEDGNVIQTMTACDSLKGSTPQAASCLTKDLIPGSSGLNVQSTINEMEQSPEGSSDEDYVPSRTPTPEITVSKKRVSWSNAEKSAVLDSMNDLVKNNLVPTYAECMNLKSKSPCLEKRTPPQIKSFVAYQSKKLRRKGNARTYWTSEEKKIVHRDFELFLKNKTLPSLSLCKKSIDDNPALTSRTPETLKAYINNVNKRMN